ncbi:hypothetical protein GCM10022215_18520 [Nocardioides fonticola]|uniref:Class I SAM-dependent methyltransferase n=1 Tax=Nocardioides fonticola TaxID=450363 RepID=A0ABP7XJC3_9ACTN
MSTLERRAVRGSRRVAVSDAGIWLPRAGARPLVIELEGRYLWSCTPVRDGRPERGGVLVAWPGVLRPHLKGRGRVRVRDAVPVHAGEEPVVHLDEEVVLGGPEHAERPLEVVDPQGLPLAVDKVGHLCRAFSATAETVREEILLGTKRALDDLAEGCGVRAYLNYGALLGAVRDGAMLAHDSDTDVCYLSRHISPADIISESYAIEREMRRRGWNLLRMSGGDIKLLLPLSDGRQCHIDIFVAFHVGETFYQLGNRSGRVPESVVWPPSSITLHGVEFPAPADPEAMLAFVYGPGWRVPDPSFAYADPPAGVRRLDGWLRGFRTTMGRWTEFHQTRTREVDPAATAFARSVRRTLPDGAPVADLGAGSGRDSFFFARKGHPVRAFEFSRHARAAIARTAQRRSLDVDSRLLILGELRSVLTAGAELARDPHELYARDLLGCLSGAERRNLWLLSRMALRGRPQRLHLEFSATGLDERGMPLPDPAPAGLVARVDLDVVRAEIVAAGGVIEHEVLEAGVDQLGRADPLVCRLRVAFPASPARPTASAGSSGPSRPTGPEDLP